MKVNVTLCGHENIVLMSKMSNKSCLITHNGIDPYCTGRAS